MNLIVTTDPLKQYPHLIDEYILEMCGLLQIWLVEGEQPTLKERLLAGYAFYSGEMTGGQLTRDGVYTYPEDNPLFPLIKFETDEEICFVFAYGIVGIFNKIDDTTWITRMD